MSSKLNSLAVEVCVFKVVSFGVKTGTAASLRRPDIMPGSVDDTRMWGPPFAKNINPDDKARPESAYFLGINRVSAQVTRPSLLDATPACPPDVHPGLTPTPSFFYIIRKRTRNPSP